MILLFRLILFSITNLLITQWPRVTAQQLAEDLEENFWYWLYGEDRYSDAEHVEHPALKLVNLMTELTAHYKLPNIIESNSSVNIDEIDFHVFNVHDFDRNKLLDGLEMLSMMDHQHHNDHHQQHSSHASQQSLIFSATLIDTILRLEDRNFDGYLDYSEFASARRKHQFRIAYTPKPVIN